MTHSWAIMIVLSVSAVLFYAGVFDATARPRFEGLASSAVQPVPEQVKLYSDGVLVVTVLNTKPYSVEMDFVDVAPIADRNDVLRTLLGVALSQGELGVFELNGYNLYAQFAESSVLLFPWVVAGEKRVDFHICLNESFSVGGTVSSQVVCGIMRQIPVDDGPSHLIRNCDGPGDGLYCDDDTNCCLVCEACYLGICDDFYGCSEESEAAGEILTCTSTAAHPEGECLVED